MTKYLSILILFAFFSCSPDNQTFDIGGKYVDVKTDLRYIDTLTVNSFTVVLDSLRTSGLTDGSGSVTAGRYHDPEIGDISASSYFRVTLPGTRTVPSSAVYDSLALIMVDNNYSTGDTLVPLTLQVHRLEEPLRVREDGFLYNTSKFNYSAEPLGSLTYRPRPNTHDTLSIRLSDELGEELLQLFLDKDDRILQLDNWLIYFKGLSVQSSAASNSIVGFATSVSLPAMRLYYHYVDFTSISDHRDFSIFGYTFNQFNHFEVTNPLFTLPASQKDMVPVKLTNKQSFVQGGTGIVTRLEIPYLKNLLQLHENLRILKAELVLEPVRNTYKTIQLPKRIGLYSTDKYNRFGSILLNVNTGNPLVGTLVVDEEYQEGTSYTFDVTNFIQSKITEATDEIPALLVTISPNEIYTTADRLVLGSQINSDSKVILKLYYMNY